MRRLLSSFLLSLVLAGLASANPPTAQYIFPSGGRQGTTVNIKVGGVDLTKRCGFLITGPGVEASKQLERTQTVWFEGPLLPLPESQQQEDYPKDMAGHVKIAADAPLGVRYGRVWTSQGGCPALKFMVGDLPEIVEQEIDGEAVPEDVTLPVTINGRIFPREDIDIWAFSAKRGQAIACEVHAARLGSPLDSLLQVVDPHGKVIAENDDAFGADSFLRFTTAEDGKYQVRIRDTNLNGGQAFIYRLTLSASPRVDRVYPLGGKRGGTTRFELFGHGVPQSAEVSLAGASGSGPHDFAHRLTLGSEHTNTFLLETDDLPEVLEAEPNDTPAQAKPLTTPIICNGRIDKPGDRDCWAVALKKGESFEFDLRAQRLGSPLNAVLTLSDAAGKELARADNVGTPQPDPLLRFTAPADGTYTVCVAERFRQRGGPEFAYRLRIDKPAAPGFRLRPIADVVSAPRGGAMTIRIQVDRLGGFAGPITLSAEGLPPHVTLEGATVAANQATVDLRFVVKKEASIRTDLITLRGTAKVGDRDVTNVAKVAAPRGFPEMEQVLLSISHSVPFKVKGEHDFRWASRGTVHQRHYQIDRGGYDGPLEITLADRQARHLQGVTAGTVIVPAGVSEFDFPVFLPPWMELGRTSRTCVTASAVIKDPDGSEHTVSFSSVLPNEQVIVVVGPERLGVETDKTSFLAKPGQTLTLSVKVLRGKGLQGPVKLELVMAAHLHGITSEPVTIAADKNSGELHLRFADKIGSLNTPLLLRATIMDAGKPVVGETKIEVLPER